MSEKIYLVDGSGYIFRAYYAVQKLSTSKGFPTNALYGFTKMLLKLINLAESDNIVIVFDAGRETFRNELYPKYKANRSECPEDLVPQMPYFRQISKALGLQVLETVGFEADDVIGTCTERLTKEDCEVIIVSGDKDLMQLVSPNVEIWDTMKDKIYKRKDVIEKFGVPPEKVVELLGLMGDSSDNIPGVSGVGPKTASQLINSYESVENILNSLDKIKEDKTIRGRDKIVLTIEENPEILKISRKLVEIDKNSPVSVFLEDKNYELKNLNKEGLLKAFKKDAPDLKLLNELEEILEFQSLFNSVSFAQPKTKEESKYKYQTVLKNDFSQFLEKLLKQKEFAFDLETTSLDVLEANIVGIAFCFEAETAYYLPLGHSKNKEEQVDINLALQSLKPIFESSETKKIGQNLKYDIGVLAKYDIEVLGVDFDSMIASYLLNPDKGSYNLTSLAQKYLALDCIEFEEVTDGSGNFSEVDFKKATEYAGQDAHFAYLLKEKLYPILEKEDLLGVFNDIEMPLVSVLSKIERNGIKIDTPFLSEMSKSLDEKLKKFEIEIEELAGEKFNQNSPKQLAHILFEKLQIPTKGLKKTKTGISTDAGTLDKLAHLHPLPKKILEYRELYKIKSTYVDALPNYISPISNRLHSNLNQTITATGRLSSSNPNLQNIPIQGEEGRKVRQAFIAENDKTLITADYSQIELRILAHLSQDKNLIKAFQDNQDIHIKTTREILGIPDAYQVNENERRIGKTMNFGIIYGMSGFRLAKTLEIPVKVAIKYIEDYFDFYSGVREYFSKLEESFSSNGYVKTIFGRKRYLDSIDIEGRDKGFLIRAGLNAPIQGSSADIIKLAMIKIHNRIKKEMPDLKMILQIHDELLFEVPKNLANQASEIIKYEMENVFVLDVPLKVSIADGKNWGEIH